MCMCLPSPSDPVCLCVSPLSQTLCVYVSLLSLSDLAFAKSFSHLSVSDVTLSDVSLSAPPLSPPTLAISLSLAVCLSLSQFACVQSNGRNDARNLN